MYATWFKLGMLTLESQRVIGLRLVKLAGGGQAARDEATLMVTEKMASATDAAWKLMSGASADSVVSDYRRKVRANGRRLLGAARSD